MVRGPVQVNKELKLRCWLVRPVTPAPFAVEYRRDGLRMHRVYWTSRAEHPDAWLLPIQFDGITPGVEESTLYRAPARDDISTPAGAEAEAGLENLGWR
jgi:hypothetical protein